MSSSVQGPSLASCSVDVDGDAEFCHRLSFGGSVTGESIIRSDSHRSSHSPHPKVKNPGQTPCTKVSMECDVTVSFSVSFE